MCHGDIDFEAYEIDRAFQIFKLVPPFSCRTFGPTELVGDFEELKKSPSPSSGDAQLDPC